MTERNHSIDSSFYIAAYESGFSPEPLPLWTDRPKALKILDRTPSVKAHRIDIQPIPGAFQLLNVLSNQECEDIIEIAETLGFHEDSPVSLPHTVRHNFNLNWVVSEEIDHIIWSRSQHLMDSLPDGAQARGLNARFRFYRYQTGDYFKPHTDGAWTGSRVIDGRLVSDAYPGLLSRYTYLIFLSDDYEGGRTEFFINQNNCKNTPTQETHIERVRTPKGGVLCFPHGSHPLHCLHSSEIITSGTKHIIRTDVLYG